ncbi:MAG: GNAT family N-acetyltransferase [Betaproteobacteria bacterium]|nr:GNAT family N-acetyltransferase [Betaproteobacteria bacterium]
MQQDYKIDGYVFRLRHATMDDAPFIVNLRSNQPFLNSGSSTIEEQKAWLQNHYAQPSAYYFIIEEKHSQQAQGTFRATIIPQGSRAKLDSWAILPGSLAATESLLLMGRFVFTTLNLNAFEALVIKQNIEALSAYKLIGAKKIAEKTTITRGKTYGCEVLELTSQVWGKQSKILEELSMRTAQKYLSASPKKQCK